MFGKSLQLIFVAAACIAFAGCRGTAWPGYRQFGTLRSGETVVDSQSEIVSSKSSVENTPANTGKFIDTGVKDSGNATSSPSEACSGSCCHGS